MSDNAVKVVQEVAFVTVMCAYMGLMYKIMAGPKKSTT